MDPPDPNIEILTDRSVAGPFWWGNDFNQVSPEMSENQSKSQNTKLAFQTFYLYKKEVAWIFKLKKLRNF